MQVSMAKVETDMDYFYNSFSAIKIITKIKVGVGWAYWLNPVNYKFKCRGNNLPRHVEKWRH